VYTEGEEWHAEDVENDDTANDYEQTPEWRQFL
jgi:hypothetical protein